MELIKGYLAGGMAKFGADEFTKSNNWRTYLKNIFETNFSDNNYKILITNPNDYYNFIDKKHASEREIMEFDIRRVLSSNFVIVNFNDPKSIGTACELAIAYKHNIPIIGLCENGEWESLHPWLKEFCTKCFDNKDDLIYYIINYIVW